MGYKIAEERKVKGWNQQKLAEMMGTNVWMITSEGEWTKVEV